MPLNPAQIDDTLARKADRRSRILHLLERQRRKGDESKLGLRRLSKEMRLFAPEAPLVLVDYLVEADAEMSALILSLLEEMQDLRVRERLLRLLQRGGLDAATISRLEQARVQIERQLAPYGLPEDIAVAGPEEVWRYVAGGEWMTMSPEDAGSLWMENFAPQSQKLRKRLLEHLLPLAPRQFVPVVEFEAHWGGKAMGAWAVRQLKTIPDDCARELLMRLVHHRDQDTSMSALKALESPQPPRKASADLALGNRGTLPSADEEFAAPARVATIQSLDNPADATLPKVSAAIDKVTDAQADSEDEAPEGSAGEPEVVRATETLWPNEWEDESDLPPPAFDIAQAIHRARMEDDAFELFRCYVTEEFEMPGAPSASRAATDTPRPGGPRIVTEGAEPPAPALVTPPPDKPAPPVPLSAAEETKRALRTAAKANGKKAAPPPSLMNLIVVHKDDQDRAKFLGMMIDLRDRGVVECFGTGQYALDGFYELLESFNGELAPSGFRQIPTPLGMLLANGAAALTVRGRYVLPKEYFFWRRLIADPLYDAGAFSIPFGEGRKNALGPFREAVQKHTEEDPPRPW